MSDEVIAVIEGCLAKDKDSWNAFVKEFAPMAMNILNGQFSGIFASEKDDIVQNAFIKLIRSGLRDFKGNSKYEFFKYFEVIVQNEARSHLSSQAKKNNTISLHQKIEGENGDVLQIDIPDDRPRQDDIAGNKAAARLIMSVLHEYTLLDRRIFLMKVDGDKDREIAAILGISMGTVASKYSRIKERMRDALGE